HEIDVGADSAAAEREFAEGERARIINQRRTIDRSPNEYSAGEVFARDERRAGRISIGHKSLQLWFALGSRRGPSASRTAHIGSNNGPLSIMFANKKAPPDFSGSAFCGSRGLERELV